MLHRFEKGRLKGDMRRKLRPNLGFICPLKCRGRMDEMSELTEYVQPRTQPLLLSRRRCADWKVERETQCLPTVVGRPKMVSFFAHPVLVGDRVIEYC